VDELRRLAVRHERGYMVEHVMELLAASRPMTASPRFRDHRGQALASRTSTLPSRTRVR
jgi:hypothetical protein